MVKVCFIFIAQVNSSLRVCGQPLLPSFVLMEVLTCLEQMFKPPLHLKRQTDLFIRSTEERAQFLSRVVERGGAGQIIVVFRQLPHHQGVQGEHLLSQELKSRETVEGGSERRMKTYKVTGVEKYKHTNSDRKITIKAEQRRS